MPMSLNSNSPNQWIHLGFSLIYSGCFYFSMLNYYSFGVLFVLQSLLVYSQIQVRLRDQKELEQIKEFMITMSAGVINQRLTPMGKTPYFAGMSELLNQSLDHIETYIRETQAVLTALEKKQLYRFPIIHGVPGVYRHALGRLKYSFNIINEKEQLEQKSLLTQQLSHLRSEKTRNNLHDIQHKMKEVVSSMDELDTVTQHSANQALTNRATIQEINHDYEQVNQTLQEMNTLADTLEESSKTINGVSKNIETIADKTNLLALNAAIEAARAGEQGRGFAVVADEVRSLAEITKQATTNIQKSIQEVTSISKQVFELTENLSTINQHFHELIQHFDRSLNEFADGAGDNYSRSNFSRMLNDLILIKLEHMLYIQECYRAVELSLEDMGDYLETQDTQRTIFYDWYENEGKQVYGHLPSYQHLHQPHDLVNSQVKQLGHTLKQFAQESHSDASTLDRIYQHVAKTEEISQSLYQKIDCLIDEKLTLEAPHQQKSAATASEIKLF